MRVLLHDFTRHGARWIFCRPAGRIGVHDPVPTGSIPRFVSGHLRILAPRRGAAASAPEIQMPEVQA
jgi:hypothetical protein